MESITISENCKIFAKTIEETALQQIYTLAFNSAYKDNSIRIMPDVHAGAGCTIGTTIKLTDKVTPNLVGVDIGCGMLVAKLQCPIKNFEEFDTTLRQQIPCGFEVHSDLSFLDTLECKHWREKLNNLHCASSVDIDYILKSIGTLGGGNHFIEVDTDVNGDDYIAIHSGSRHLGVIVAKYYQNIAIKLCSNLVDKKALIEKLKAEGREKEIQSVLTALPKESINKDLAYVHGQAMRDYIDDIKICQEFAEFNRQMMLKALRNALNLEIESSFTTIHNYIDVDRMILRKGSVSALDGETLIIPMNMRDGSLICIGKGNPDWNYSAPHGAGRIMSRSKAKETLSLEEFEKSMEGIFTTSVNSSTIDESPMVYKPIEEIMECIQDTVHIVSVIKPIYNFKAS